MTSADDSKRANDEARAERAARNLKAELKRARALVEEARRRLERGRLAEAPARPSRLERKG